MISCGKLVVWVWLLKSYALALLAPSSVSTRKLYAVDQEEEGEEKKRVIFCLGGPGAGKGTQCELLEEEFGLVHLSAGELLRNEPATGSADGDLIESYLCEGKIVPVKISLGLLKREMKKQTATFIIDGFPRNQDNLDGWNQLMHSFATVDAVLYFDIPTETMIDRMLARGETSGRSDDNIAAAKKRINTFKESTLPILDYFQSHPDIKLCKISGLGSIEEVWNRTKAAIEPLLAPTSLTTSSSHTSNKDSLLETEQKKRTELTASSH